ncbi:MAG: biopolymer transporter ExbD [Pseudomonadota bacterium]
MPVVRNRRHRRSQPISQINVTPFVDVMLVLLIVFMVTAPLLSVGIKVDLPQTQAASLNETDEPLVITLNDKGEIYVQETLRELEELPAFLQAITNNDFSTQLFVRADRTLPYGTVMGMMGIVNQAGFSKVTLLAQIPK